MRLYSYRWEPSGPPEFARSRGRYFGPAFPEGLDVEGVNYGAMDSAGRIDVDGSWTSAEALRPGPAISRPGKVICVGLNYRDHVAEGGRDAPTRPLLFAKFANAVIADGEPIVRPEGTHALDLEVELGVVIGRIAKGVSRSDAMGHVAGYVVVNDVSARDWQGPRRRYDRGRRATASGCVPRAATRSCPWTRCS